MTRPPEDGRPAGSADQVPSPGRTGHTGRRAGESGTREAILDAARRQFADNGYERATIRGIAADAGVDAALVHHYYGNKERLFGAAMRLPVVPGEVLAAALAPGGRAPGESLGQHLVRSVLTAWEDPQIQSTFLGLLRSAVTSAQAAAMLREFIAASILGRIAGAAAGAGTGDAERRACLVASQMLGLALCRFVLGIEPLASADADELAVAIGPTVDRYLTADLS